MVIRIVVVVAGIVVVVARVAIVVVGFGAGGLLEDAHPNTLRKGRTSNTNFV